MSFHNSVRSSWFDTLVHHKKIVGFVVVLLLAVTVALYTYKRSIKNNECVAQGYFAECMEEYNRVLNTKDAQWQEVEHAFATGYQRHAQTSLAPYFLAFQAEALVQLNKLPEALVVMDKAVSSIEKKSPFYGLFATKRSLMKIDSSDEALKGSGLQELTQLAEDQNNISRDQAQYHLGLYYWSQDNTEQAQKCWQPLLAFTAQDKATSMWAQLAQSKLQQVA